MFVIAEILPIISCLSETLQIENLDFGSIKPALERGIAALNTLSNSGKADWQKELQNELQGHDELCAAIVLTNLSELFPHQNIDILSAGEVFDPRYLPSTPAECYLKGQDKCSKSAL